MMDLATKAVEAALARGASCADARVVRLETEELGLRGGSLARAEHGEDAGIGLRVVVDGAFGFAATPRVEPGDLGSGLLADLAGRAVAAARSLARARTEPVRLAPAEAHRGSYRTPVAEDAFALDLGQKLDFLRAVDARLQGRSETVVREANLSLRREEQWQATSEGSELHQLLVRTGAGLSTTAAAHGNVERRSWPASFGGNYKGGGFEVVRAMGLEDHAERMRDEAVELCSAELCPGGVRTLILGGSQLMLQIHESVGHPTEIDRVHGHEIDLAGSSFATTDLLGEGFRYGSEHVNLVADSTVEGGLDTRGWDDEGTPSSRWPIVEAGVFRGYLSSREWSEGLGGAGGGSSRAEGWFHPPIVRITNLSLLPGAWDLDDLVADTEDGALFCDTVRTWSIDQKRLNFQFTCEVAREVRGGRLGRLLRRPTYQGRSPEFWRSCDAVCGPRHFELWGVVNCGKGNPMQVAEMSHGAAPARFRGVTFVGN